MGFKETLKEYQELVNNELDFFLENEALNQKDEFVKMFYDNLKQFVMNGGKRLRPIAVIQAYKAISGEVTPEIIKTSIAVELYHNSTLVHDDIMDEDVERRNKPTTFKIMKDHYENLDLKNESDLLLFKDKASHFAVSQAILGGNILVELSKIPLENSSFKPADIIAALSILTKCSEHINIGQIKDILLEIDSNPTEEKYYQMIRGKTGQLFVSSIQIGAILAGASKEQLDVLTDYAWSAATTFQLQDDIMDMLPNNKKGHERGSDIKQGKMTLLVIKALEKSNEEQKKILKHALGNSKATEKELEDAINVVYDTKAMDYVKELAFDKIKKGKKFLHKADFNKEGLEFFEGFADFMMERDI